jgi:hypothetical protein
MANDNIYPGQNPGQSIGTGEGESPLAKPVVPNMDVRTMASDMQSMGAGNAAPKPYAPQASAPENIPMSPAPSAPQAEQSFQIPQPDMSMGAQPAEPAPKKNGRGVFTALAVFIAVIGLAALGYFVIYPIFFAAPVAPVVENTPTPEPVLPVEPEPLPEPSSTIPNVPAPHVSLLTMAADATESPSLPTMELTNLKAMGMGTSANPTLTEIVLKDQSEVNLTLSQITALLAPTTFTPNVIGNFESDPTFFAYTDKDGRWLGLVAKVRSDASLEAVKADVSKLEQSNETANFFGKDPGTPGEWKNSQVAGATDVRYQLFSNAGFAFDYGWVGNKLVIATSYDGFKEAVRRLQ